MFFILQFVNVEYHIDRFVDIENSLHHWDKSHLIMVYDPFFFYCSIIALQWCVSFCFITK